MCEKKEGVFCAENVKRSGPACLPCGGRRLTFREAITLAEGQVEFGGMDYADKLRPLVHDMCRTMAEVYMAPEGMIMKVNGEDVAAGMISDVFAELTQDHVINLAGRLYDGWGCIAHPKAYLRSALYNVVFEFESVILRDVRADSWD